MQLHICLLIWSPEALAARHLAIVNSGPSSRVKRYFLMNIGELARSAQVNIDTIRYYERRGVLASPARRPSGYRVYSAETVERLRLARALQSRGFTLEEIVGAFHASTGGTATWETERWRLPAALG